MYLIYRQNYFNLITLRRSQIFKKLINLNFAVWLTHYQPQNFSMSKLKAFANDKLTVTSYLKFVL